MEKVDPSANAEPAGAGSTEAEESQSAAEKIASDAREQNGDALDEAALVDGMEKTKLDVPAVDTKPGQPVGDLVFDHPPTTPEIRDAMKQVA